MAKVPDTDTFALTDVEAVLDDNLPSGSITGVTDNGSGDARFATADTTGLEVGKQVVITGTTNHNGTHQVVVLTSTYFETYELYVENDSGTWTRADDVDSLSMCFTIAEAAKFDPRYEGSKDRLSNFRNYGYKGDLVWLETDDDGGQYRGMCDSGGDGWIGVCRDSSGVSTYNINPGTGEIAVIDTQTVKYQFDAGNSDCINCWHQDDWIFVVAAYSGSSSTLFSVPVDALGNLSAEDDEYNRSSSDIMYAITGDGSKYLFVCTESVASDPKIWTFSYDSNGDFTLEQTYDVPSNVNVYDMWYGYWNSTHYLIAATTAGMKSYSINQTTGALTLIDTEDGTLAFHGCIGDEDKQLIWATESDGDVRCYSVSDTGYFTLEDTSGESVSAGALVAYSDDGQFIFSRGYDTNTRVYIYRLDENDDFIYEGYEAISNIDDILCAYAKADRLYVTRGTSGISVYRID